MPLVSVVVPAYGHARGVEDLLTSLTLQTTRTDFEVIIVDDGSPDPLEPVVPPFVGRLDVRCLRLSNGGPARARNAGVEDARGEWILFTDHDCVPCPDWVSEMTRGFEVFPGALLGGSKLNGCPDNPWSTAHEAVCEFATGWTSPHAQPYFSANCLGVRREQFRSVGGFDVRFPFAQEDRDFATRWRARGFPLQAVPRAAVRHRHPFTARSYLRHHFRYGRGAVVYHRAHSPSGPAWPLSEKLRFYAGMFRYPARNPDGRARLLMGARMLLSQAAYASGYYSGRLLSPS